MANTALAAEFLALFRPECQALSDRITSQTATPTLSQKEELLSSVAKLRKDLNDATPFLPTYDQRQSELQLKQLENKLEVVIQDGQASGSGKAKGGSKFSFKRTPKATSSVNSNPEKKHTIESLNEEPAIATEGSKQESDPSPPAESSSHITDMGTKSNESSRTINVHNRSGERLTLSEIIETTSPPDVAESVEQGLNRFDVSLASLSNCIVDLVGRSDLLPGVLGAFHARDLKRCIIIVPSIKGSALIHDCSDCIIAVACHQFRIHTSSRVDVYLHVTSLPVLEKCTAMRFAPYSKAMASSSTDDLEEQVNRFSEVQDFLWIRSTPSPNWSILPTNERLSEEEWSGLQRSDERLEDVIGRLTERRGQEVKSGAS
ncbi:hypothetical protein FRC20_006276 [Serendipita sp. 405]|nr:hypothetical protein FRC15_006240 [Serendipita sp. 397]KAG8838570.1 hypothetical protein FRC20_006276 [Serendipita sp. 405]